MPKKNIKAFTLLEVVIVIAAFTALALIFLPLGIEQLQSSKIDNVAKDLKSTIYSQAQSAFAFKNNKSYGIALFSDHYITYTGESLALADTQTRVDLSREVTLQNISLSNSGNELSFTKGSFRPKASGSFKVMTSQSGYLIAINSEGLLIVTKL